MKTLIFLAISLISFRPANASDLVTIYVIPAPAMDWTNVGTLARTSVSGLIANWVWTKKLNQESIRPIGHSILELKCGNSEKNFSAFTADNTMNDEATDWVVKKNAGLSAMFLKFGSHFEDYSVMQRLLKERKASGKGIFVKYKVTHEQCLKAKEFVDEFRASPASKYYGLALEPLKGEGAGCTSYVTAALRYAGIIDDKTLDSWALKLRAPMKFIGVPYNPGNEVKLTTLMTTTEPFAKKNEPGKDLVAMDPTHIYKLLKKDALRLQTLGRIDFHGDSAWYMQIGKMPGLLVEPAKK